MTSLWASEWIKVKGYGPFRTIGLAGAVLIGLLAGVLGFSSTPQTIVPFRTAVTLTTVFFQCVNFLVSLWSFVFFPILEIEPAEAGLLYPVRNGKWYVSKFTFLYLLYCLLWILVSALSYGLLVNGFSARHMLEEAYLPSYRRYYLLSAVQLIPTPLPLFLSCYAIGIFSKKYSVNTAVWIVLLLSCFLPFDHPLSTPDRAIRVASKVALYHYAPTDLLPVYLHAAGGCVFVFFLIFFLHKKLKINQL